MKMTEAPFGARGLVLSEERAKAVSKPARTSKIDKILKLLCAGVSLNRFEAERYGDHCLNSTVATLRNRYRVDIASKWEQVPNRFGCTTRVKRYWLTASQEAGAQGGSHV